jgi:hypothetical protein
MRERYKFEESLTEEQFRLLDEWFVFKGILFGIGISRGYCIRDGKDPNQLPDGLVFENHMDLSNLEIKKLPNGLVFNGSVNLSHNELETLPEDIIFNGYADISNNKLSCIPEGIVFNGGVNLLRNVLLSLSEPIGLMFGNAQWSFEDSAHGTILLGNVSSVPVIYVNNRIVLIPSGYSEIAGKKLFKMHGISFHVSAIKQIGDYTYYKNKYNPRLNYLTDDATGAHCGSIRMGVIDIRFKKEDRDISIYEDIDLSSVNLSYDDSVILYRDITGACSAGVEDFLNCLKEEKELYSVNDIINLTEGQYGNKELKMFFKVE